MNVSKLYFDYLLIQIFPVSGSKIVYEKSVLLNLRNSPISKTPPQFSIPDSILSSPSKKTNQTIKNGLSNSPKRRPSKPETTEISEDQFQIDI